MKKRLLFIVPLILAFVLGYWIYTNAFSLSQITIDQPIEYEWMGPEIAAEEEHRILSLLDQPYHYLGQGNQVYAFVSQDGAYVIKFFKFSHLKPGNLYQKLPGLAWIKKTNEHKEKVKLRKIERIFNAHRIAYQYDKENAGLLFAHLHKGSLSKKTITVSDRFGITHSIPLEQTYFVLQKKGIPLRSILNADFSKGDIESAKRQIKKVLRMYVQEYQAGIFDHDHNILYNIGFAGDQPIRLDVGKIAYDPAFADPEFYRRDLEKIIHKRLAVWLEKYWPQYKEEIIIAILNTNPIHNNKQDMQEN